MPQKGYEVMVVNTELVDKFVERIPKEERIVRGRVVYSDEVHVLMLSGMGLRMLEGVIPRAMIRDFIISYIKTGMYRYAYLYVDREEIDNVFAMEVLGG